MTKLDATRKWVRSFNAFPSDMIYKLICCNPDEWKEVTEPSYGDRVYVFNLPDDCNSTENSGEIQDYINDEDIFVVCLDDGNVIQVNRDDFEVEKYDNLPMWGTMWSFKDGTDDYWLESLDGIQIMSECGFRIYEHTEFGYFFGIDGAGYDFYEQHWMSLYNKRGLKWHDE